MKNGIFQNLICLGKYSPAPESESFPLITVFSIMGKPCGWSCTSAMVDCYDQDIYIAKWLIYRDLSATIF